MAVAQMKDDTVWNKESWAHHVIRCTLVTHRQVGRVNHRSESRSSDVITNLYKKGFRPSGTVCCIPYSYFININISGGFFQVYTLTC